MAVERHGMPFVQRRRGTGPGGDDIEFTGAVDPLGAAGGYVPCPGGRMIRRRVAAAMAAVRLSTPSFP